MKLRPYLQHLAIGRIMANRLSPQFVRTLLWPLHQEQPRCACAVLCTREWTQPLSEAYGLGTSLGIPSSALMLALPMPRLLWRHLVCPVRFTSEEFSSSRTATQTASVSTSSLKSTWRLATFYGPQQTTADSVPKQGPPFPVFDDNICYQVIKQGCGFKIWLQLEEMEILLNAKSSTVGIFGLKDESLSVSSAITPEVWATNSMPSSSLLQLQSQWAQTNQICWLWFPETFRLTLMVCAWL